MIRLPHITGKTIMEKVDQIIKYLREIAEAVQQLQANEGEK